MGIEKLQYRELDRYLNATTFLMIIAWRVQCLTKAGRDESSSSCEMYFQSSEWKAVWLVSNVSEPLPNQPPTLGEFMITVATLGGYVNRRQQGPPGVRTMWRGMRRLDALAEAYRVFGPEARQRSNRASLGPQGAWIECSCRVGRQNSYSAYWNNTLLAFRPISSRGRIAAHAPISAVAPGMPQTTLVASS